MNGRKGNKILNLLIYQFFFQVPPDWSADPTDKHRPSTQPRPKPIYTKPFAWKKKESIFSSVAELERLAKVWSLTQSCLW